MYRSTSSRRRLLLQYLHNAKQQLLRLYMLASWAPKSKVAAQIYSPDHVLQVTADFSSGPQQVADALHATFTQLQGGHQPVFDVQTAWDVLSKGEQLGLFAVASSSSVRKGVGVA